MHLDKRTSADLDYLKAFAAFLVVLGHCLSYYTAWQPLPLFAGIAEDLIYHVHVPLFFTISGFLCHRQPLRPYYKKKVLRVLVPFWFFAFLKVFFSTVIVRHFAHADTIGGQLYDAFVIGRAYWFAYAIFLMLLIAPLFWEKDEKTAPRKAIIGMIAAAVFCAFCSIKELSLLTEVFQISRTVKHLPFFLSGMVLLVYYPKLKEFFDRRRIPALCLAAAITAASALLLCVAGEDRCVSAAACHVLRADGTAAGVGKRPSGKLPGAGADRKKCPYHRSCCSIRFIRSCCSLRRESSSAACRWRCSRSSPRRISRSVL